MLDFLGQVGHLIMTPLYYAVSAVMVAWHWLFTHDRHGPRRRWHLGPVDRRA